jgi:hypothetical protein
MTLKTLLLSIALFPLVMLDIPRPEWSHHLHGIRAITNPIEESLFFLKGEGHGIKLDIVDSEI